MTDRKTRKKMQRPSVSFILRQSLLLLFAAGFASRAPAVCPPSGPCGAGALCRCETHGFLGLTDVRLPLLHPDYLPSRLFELAVKLGPTWQEGDILFVGDSLTDFARLDFDPLVPRSLNAGIAGIQIDQLIHILDLFEQNLPRPSKVVVLIGSNDIRSSGYPAFEADKFQRLLDRLKAFKTRHNSEIIVRSIPPGEPDVTADLTPDINRIVYNLAVLQANHFLKRKSAEPEYAFTYFDDYSVYLKPGENELAYNLFAGRRYAPCVPVDNLHIGCNGYMFFAANVSRVLFPALEGTSGTLENLTTEPAALPRPNLAHADKMSFKYVHYTLEPNTSANFSVDNSSVNYVSVFDPYTRFFTPSFDHGSPSTESLQPDGQRASLTISNTIGIPQTVVLCLGAAAGGTWYVSPE